MIYECNNQLGSEYVTAWIEEKELPCSQNLLLYCDNDKWVAIDNRTCDCWVEEFNSKSEAINWLNE